MASNLTKFIEIQECEPFCSKEIEINIEMSECEDSSRVHNAGNLHKSVPSTLLTGTDAFKMEEKKKDLILKTKLKNIRYIRLDRSTNLDTMKTFLEDNYYTCYQKMTFSVLSDSECDNDVDDKEPNKSIQSIRKMVCSSLVEAAAITNAWIITSGLNKGVDQLIGNEVKQRVMNEDIVPGFLLGISNWEFVAKNLLNDTRGPVVDDSGSNTAGIWPNQNHSHFFIVDDNPGSECSLREEVEEALCTKQPLIYVLIGGGVSAIHFVKRILAKERSVIIAMGTGGAADIISETGACKGGATLENLPEVAQQLFTCLHKLLTESFPTANVQQIINKIKAESKLELLFEIVQLLDQKSICGEGAQRFKDKIATPRSTAKTTKEMLVGIKDILISTKTRSDNSSQSASDAQYNTVNRMREVFEQILVVNGIPPNNADGAVNGLGNEILSETLANIRLVTTDIKTIRAHIPKHRVIQFDITCKEKKTIFRLIDEALQDDIDHISQLGTGYIADNKLSETRFHRKEDNDDVVTFIKKTFKKRECSRFQSKPNPPKSEICECGYNRNSHSDKALQNESNQSEPPTETFPTDAFGKLNYVEDGEWKKSKDIRYVRLDHRKDVSKISYFLLNVWQIDKSDVIFSVLSDSDFDNVSGKGDEVIATRRNKSIQNFKKTICSSTVYAAAETNAWIITGGLNKGVDQLIGNEVNRRLANGDKIPKAVLGICNWGCIEEKRSLLIVQDSYGSDFCKSDIISTGMCLNQHHTHFLLVDDGTQKSGCERILREKVELALMKWDTRNYHGEYNRKPLIYFLIGGSVVALNFIERALSNGIPVVVATGTGGAADIISGGSITQSGLTLENVPEIFEKLFIRLGELLKTICLPENKARDVIDDIKGNTKLELFLKIIELLDKRGTSGGDTQQFKNDIANLKKGTTNELLTEIKNLLVFKDTPFDDCKYSATKAESGTVNRMRDVIEQMLLVYEIPQEKAKQAVDDLEKDVVEEALAYIRLVLASDLDAIREHDYLIKFNNKQKQMEAVIVEALKKVKRNVPTALYSLFAAWENEIFFKQLLLDNWMQHEHEIVLKQLLRWQRRVNRCKYIGLMMEHVGDCNWLTKLTGSQVIRFAEGKLCGNLLKKLHFARINTDTDQNHLSILAKKAFVWCVQNNLPETAMRFWVKGQDCLAMAVLAYSMAKEQKDYTHEETKFKQSNSKKQEDNVNMVKYKEMERQQQFFEKLALDFVRNCHMDNAHDTYRLLSYKVEDLDDQTPLQIALNANFGAFFYSDLLIAIWSENIQHYSKHNYIPVMVSVACPMLAPRLLEIEADGTEDDDELFYKIPERYLYVVFNFWVFKTFLQSPLVKFYYWFISYIGYLILFSIVMLTDFRATISPSEMALIIWTFILATEEVRQLIGDRSDYMSNEWNYFDIGAMALFIIGFVLRMLYQGDPTICPDCLYVARIILAFSLMIFFCRTLQFLSIYESLGPKIYMLYGLVADLVGFLLILGVFVSAYGVVSNVILYPNQPLSTTLLKDVFYDAWWSVIQHFNREDVLGLNCNTKNISSIITAEYCSSTSDDNIDYVRCKENQCPANNWIVSILLAFYAMLTCIMLLNLLIAMFNSTFTAIDEKEKEVSNIQRFRLISEFRSHSVIPPPFCAITYPCLIIGHLYNRWKFLHRLSSSEMSSTTVVEDGHNGEESRPSQSVVRRRRNKRISEMKSWENSMATRYYKETIKNIHGTRKFEESSDAIDSAEENS